jgi:hypothetical protein
MNTCRLAVICAGVCAFFVFAEEGGPVSIAGRWQSTEQVSDGPHMILNVERTVGEFGGTLEMGGLTVEGEEDVRMEFAIRHARLLGDVFIFEVCLPGPEFDVLHVEMTLKENGEAELKFVAEDDRPIDDGPRFRMKREEQQEDKHKAAQPQPKAAIAGETRTGLLQCIQACANDYRDSVCGSGAGADCRFTRQAVCGVS